MEYLLRRTRDDYFTELIGFQFWQVISTIELLTCSSYRHVFAQQRAVSQLIAGFPSRVLKNISCVTCDSGGVRMGGGKNDFFITATIRELASVTCHAVKRWRFAPFDKFTFHFPMRMPDVTIFGCTPDITIRTNCQRTRLIQRAVASSSVRAIRSALDFAISPDAAISLAKCSALPPVTTASIARFWMSYTLSAASRGSDLMYLTCSATMDFITCPRGALFTRLRSSRLMVLLCLRHCSSFLRTMSAVKFSATFVAQG